MKAILLLGAAAAVWLTGCVNVKTEPIRVEPIEITMNVNLRIARELDDFFTDLDTESKVMEVAPTEEP
ncbi:MAG: hypothetical protein KDM81_11580 [Verrucomicrobiae bacterium]|nr:hypothetical protein [Verrucomicrobiae bacterium]MCP5518094.1 hypothetical protein [Verrucomicrobiales bacterium]